MIISIIFFAFFNNVKPYLMPSNNTFAIFVHFQVTFTLACTLLLRMNERFSKEDREAFQIDQQTLAYALLISNASVLVIGLFLILRACFFTSEGDFLDSGFDDQYDEHGREPSRNDETGQIQFIKSKSTDSESGKKGEDDEFVFHTPRNQKQEQGSSSPKNSVKTSSPQSSFSSLKKKSPILRTPSNERRDQKKNKTSSSSGMSKKEVSFRSNEESGNKGDDIENMEGLETEDGYESTTSIPSTGGLSLFFF